MVFLSYLWPLLASLALYALQSLARSHFSQPRNIPGPFLARFTRLWYLFGILKGDFEQKNIALHRLYAQPRRFTLDNRLKTPYYQPVVRVGPNLYSVSEPSKLVYGISSRMEKSSWYDGWKAPGRESIDTFTLRNIPAHAKLRKTLQNTYAISSIVSYESFVDERTSVFQDRLREMSSPEFHNSSGRGFFNLGRWFQFYAFDVISSVTYSKKSGFLDAGRDVDGIIEALDKLSRFSVLSGVYAWLLPAFSILIRFLPEPQDSFSKLVRQVTKLQQRRKARRREGHKEEDFQRDRTPDFVDRLIEVQMKAKDYFTDAHLITCCIQNLGAGSDTTAISLSAILYQLIKNPAVMEKLRAEIAAQTAKGACEERTVSFKAGQAMPYLQAVIKEGMRMHPAVGLPLWRVVGKGGAEIAGTWFPEGSEVGVNCWVAHFNRDVWGSDVNTFRPERWLESGPEKLKEMGANYFPFGLGSRTCIGKHISYFEMTKLVPQLVRDFDFELQYPNQEWSSTNYWFVKPSNFMVKVKRLRSRV